MSFLSELPQYVISGLTTGSIYGMTAIGFTLIYNATGVVNFAQGEFVTYGALIAISLVAAKLPVIAAVILAALAVMLLGALLERFAIRPARNASVITLIIITIGASMLLRGLAANRWGQDALPMPSFSGDTPIVLGKGLVSLAPQQLWVMGVVLVTMVALWLLGEKTQVGKAMRACAMNRSAAQLTGIPVSRMVMLSFALSGMLGGLAGAVFAPIVMGQYNMGTLLGLKGFAAAILGGIGNPVGAVVGGLALGLLENLSTAVDQLRLQGRHRLRRHAARAARQALRPAGPAHEDGLAMGTRTRVLWFALFAAALAALPLVMKDGYHLGLVVLIGINTIIVLGLNLLMGYAGQVSLGQAAFVGIGAYTTAVLTTTLGWSPWLGLLAATALGGVTAWLVGIPLLRFRGHYLAMGTLGFGMIVHIVIVQWESLTKGTVGISSIPPLSLAHHTFEEPRRMYYLVAAAVLGSLIVASNIVASRVGRALRAVHGSEVAASISGVNVARYKRQVFALSGALAGLAGALFAHYQMYVSPESFDLTYSISLVVMAVVGGMTSIWGAIFGAVAITLLNESLRALLDCREIGFGLLVVLLMMFLPNGLWQGIGRGGERIISLKRRTREGAHVR